VGAQDAAGHLAVHDVPRRRARPAAIVCQVGKSTLLPDARAIEDLHAMLVEHGTGSSWGSADEHKPAKEGSVEAWGRSPDNPVGGFYGLKEGLRGRFGMTMPPLLEELGLAGSSTTRATTACAAAESA
jgi:hypothetical protein